MKRISFDFDYTMTRKDVRSIAEHLIAKGYELWIVTSRYDNTYALDEGWDWIPGQNEKVFTTAEELGIPKERIIFTNRIPKIEFLTGKGFLVHLDDNVDELIAIMQSKDNCIPINVDNSDWIKHFEEALEIKI